MYIYDLIRGHLQLIIGALGVIIGLLSIVYFRKYKKPSYILKTMKFETKKGKNPKLKILYEDNPVEILSLSRVAIFNDGNQAIRGSDIARRDPLRIITSRDFRVFDPEFFYIKNEANDFSLEESEEGNVININFDYMNGGDGCIVQFLHDGATSDDISVVGSFVDVQKFVRMEEDKITFKEYFGNLFGILIGVIGWGLLDIFSKSIYHFSTLFEYIILFSFEISYFFFFFFRVFPRLRKTKKEFYLDKILQEKD